MLGEGLVGESLGIERRAEVGTGNRGIAVDIGEVDLNVCQSRIHDVCRSARGEAAHRDSGDARSRRDEDHGCRTGGYQQRAHPDADPEGGAVLLRRGLARSPLDCSATVIRRHRLSDRRGLGSIWAGCGNEISHEFTPRDINATSSSIIRARDMAYRRSDNEAPTFG